MRHLASAATAMTLAAALAIVPGAAAEDSATLGLPRGDVTATIGWLNGNKSGLRGRWGDDWYNRGIYGSALAGWYWTEHHKSEIELGASAAPFWTAVEYPSPGGFPAYGSSQFTVSTRHIAVGQRYQFLHNAWVHPHVGAGLDLTWERINERDEAVIEGRPVPRIIQDARVVPTRTDLRVRPFAEAGFKAYVSRRGFFRADLRFGGFKRLDEVILRCGFGMDF